MEALNFGSAYPKGDEESLFALGDAWNKAATDLERLEPDLRQVTGAVPQYYQSAGAEQVSAEFATLFDNKDYSIQKLVENLHSLGHDTRSTATTIEYTKIQEEAFALLTLWTVGSLMASLYGDVLVPAYLAIAKEGLAVFAESMMKRIAALASRAALESLAKPLSREVVIPLSKRIVPAALNLGKGALIAGGMGAGLDAGIQAIQIEMGHRDDGFDLKQTFQTSLEWGAGGLAGAPVHSLTEGFLKKTLPQLPSRLGGFAAGGAGGVVGALGMYGAGLGVQRYDKGNWGDVDKTLHMQLLAGGLGMGALGGMHSAGKGHGGSPATQDPSNVSTKTSPTDGTPREPNPEADLKHDQPNLANTHDHDQQPAKEVAPAAETDKRAEAPNSNAPQNLSESRANTPEQNRPADAVRPAENPVRSAPVDQSARPATVPERAADTAAAPREVAPSRPSPAESPARAAPNLSTADSSPKIVAGTQDRPVVANRALEARPIAVTPESEVRQVGSEPAARVAGTAPGPTTLSPELAPEQHSAREVTPEQAPTGSTPTTPDGPTSPARPLEPRGDIPQEPGTHPAKNDQSLSGTDPNNPAPDHLAGYDPANQIEPAVIFSTPPHPSAEHPLEIRRRIDKVTGVEADPALAKARTEFEDFYKEQNAEASKATDVTPGDSGSPSAQPAYETRRFSYGPDDKLTTLTVKVHLDEVGNVSPEHLREITGSLHATADRVFNTGDRLLSGDRLHVELEFVDDPAEAHLKASIGNPHETTDPHVWNRETPPDVLAEHLREHLGLSSDTGGGHTLDEIDVRRISNDIAIANTESHVTGLPQTRVITEHYLDDLEFPEHQWAVEDALRDGDKFLVHADPRTNPYGDLINDGGPHETGRSNNCLDNSLAALSSFLGDPQVAHPRWPDLLPDGTIDSRGPEQAGNDRALHWLGGAFSTWGYNHPDTSVPQQFSWLHDHIAQMGEGSAALIVNSWAGGGAHATVVVFPKDAAGPLWWDPQQRTISETPPPSMTNHSTGVWFTALDPNAPNGGITGAGAVPHTGPSGGVSGPHPAAGPEIQHLPDRVRLGLSPETVGGEPTADSGSSKPGGQRPNGSGDRSPEPASDNDRRAVRRSDSDGETSTGRTDLSSSLDGDTPADRGDGPGDRVSGDRDVPESNPSTDPRASVDHQQEDTAAPHEPAERPGALHASDGLGTEAVARESDLAGTGDHHVLEQTDPGTHPAELGQKLPDETRPDNEVQAPEPHPAGAPADSQSQHVHETRAGLGDSPHSTGQEGPETSPRSEPGGRDHRPTAPEYQRHTEEAAQAPHVSEEDAHVTHSSEEEIPRPVSMDELVTEYGMPERNQRAFQGICEQFDYVIDVRPTTPSAVHWLEQGAMPKSKYIKAKTISDLDVYLGAPEEHVGLVGYFEPKMPALEEVPAHLADEIGNRYAQRLNEWNEFRDPMAEHAHNGDFEVRDKVVYGRDYNTGEYRPLTGDHDIFDIRKPNGDKLSRDEYWDIVNHMVNEDMGVMHGAHTYWPEMDPPVHEGIYQTIIDKHQPGKEPLIRFSPDSDPILVDASTPVQDVVDGTTHSATATDAGASFHPDDAILTDLAGRVPADPTHFTADVHITEDGLARIGDRTYTPEEFGNLLRQSGWDGNTPIRLIGCDAGTNGFASRLATHLGADVLAPTKPAWSDTHGRLYTSTAETHPDGTRRPRIPPDGEWETHHPDGTKTTATQDGFAPGTQDGDKHGLTGDDARDRGEVHHFDTNEEGRTYGESVLGPIRNTLSGNEFREVQLYTKSPWINEFLRHPDPPELLNSFFEDYGHQQQLMRLTGGKLMPPSIEMLDAVMQHPNLDPPLRAAIDSVLSEPYPYKRLDELWFQADKIVMMRDTFGTVPTAEVLQNHIDLLDQATGRSTPEGFEITRGVTLDGIDHLAIDQHGTVLDGKNPQQLINTIQTERAYMSTSLGKTPPEDFNSKVRMELEVPTGSKGVWIGDRSAAGPENEFILQRGTRYLITDVIENPEGPGYAGVEYLIKGVVVDADYAHESSTDRAPDHESPPSRPAEKVHPEESPGLEGTHPDTQTTRAVDAPDDHHIPFQLGDEQLGPDPAATLPNDRPTSLTTHLQGRFEEIRSLATEIVHSMSDPARQGELSGLRHDFAQVLDRIGLMDLEAAATPWRLLGDHDPAFKKYLADNGKALLTHEPHTQSTAELYDNPTTETAAGASFHPDDAVLADLAARIPEDPTHFTADVHITEDGLARIGDRTYTPEEFGNLLRQSNWDGRTPIRLIGCDAGTNGFATRLAQHLGVDVLAPTKPAWSDTHGRLYTSTAETHPDGTRRPRIPPDGEWETHHPDGTKTTASTDGFAPGTHEDDKHTVGLGDDARDRAGIADESGHRGEPLEPQPSWHGSAAGDMRHYRLPVEDVSNLSHDEQVAALQHRAHELADDALKPSMTAAEAEAANRQIIPKGQHRIKDGCAGTLLHDGILTAHTSMTKIGNQLMPSTHPVVQHLLDNIKADHSAGRIDKIGGGHGKCAEIALISDRLTMLEGDGGRITSLAGARALLEGSQIHTRTVGTLIQRRTGTVLRRHNEYLEPCDTCKYILPELGIEPI
ncbi:toxin glutamine deamidase domain-containing protein [Nocardia sp. NBC_01327]|uniref:toxin glutamine deamidase domain-containing protein n=1 Tax=Nocardia sp. NBC_01327 TaxID=2903593 RepID=UPI002E167F69|nr:toxin glutamine deamidase domain-containing protein [Nocardia sp. NBC_01327]